MAETQTSLRFRRNLQGEVDSADLYKTLAEAEQDPHLREVRPAASSCRTAQA